MFKKLGHSKVYEYIFLYPEMSQHLKEQLYEIDIFSDISKSWIFFFFFETAFHYVGLSLLEHTIMTIMASNSQRSKFLYLGFSKPGVKGSHHYVQLMNTF